LSVQWPVRSGTDCARTVVGWRRTELIVAERKMTTHERIRVTEVR
jgi:hypothetical protein